MPEVSPIFMMGFTAYLMVALLLFMIITAPSRISAAMICALWPLAIVLVLALSAYDWVAARECFFDMDEEAADMWAGALLVAVVVFVWFFILI
jgi:hypothetical protein